MKKNKYVTFEQAKLLKEFGFNEPCLYHYDDSGELHPNLVLVRTLQNRYVTPDEHIMFNIGHSNGMYSATTLHEAADWLRDKGLYTYPKLNALGKWYAVVHFFEYAEVIRQEEMFDDFYSALSHGIDYCLSALKYKEKQ